MLTNAAVKAARPAARAYKLADSLGLILHVAPSGRKTYRQRFRWGGAEQLLTLGATSELTLAGARAARDANREQLRRGEDPRRSSGAANAVKKIDTFEPAARRWHAHQAPRWSPAHTADVLASLERDAFPALGGLALAAIDAPAVLACLRDVEARGRRETAGRLRQRISAVFQFAMSEGRAEADPAAIVRRAMLPPAPQRAQPALVDPAEARALLAEVEALEAAPAAKLASRFLALTAVRLAVVRGARWREFEGLDGDAPIWRVPAARLKLAAAKKLDSTNDHLVPLAPAAVSVLEAARDHFAGPGKMIDLVFPGRGGAAPIGEGAIGALIARTRFAGRHVPHGWRASFSTILNERYRKNRAIIDQALGHTLKGEDGRAAKVEGAYNRAGYLVQRRWLFERWADLLACGASAGS